MSYTEVQKDEIMRGQCFNNACTMVALWFGKDPVMSIKAVFELAEQLYDEAIRRDWRNYGRPKTKPLIEGSNHMTEKEGRELDPDIKKEELVF